MAVRAHDDFILVDGTKWHYTEILKQDLHTITAISIGSLQLHPPLYEIKPFHWYL